MTDLLFDDILTDIFYEKSEGGAGLVEYFKSNGFSKDIDSKWWRYANQMSRDLAYYLKDDLVEYIADLINKDKNKKEEK